MNPVPKNVGSNYPIQHFHSNLNNYPNYTTNSLYNNSVRVTSNLNSSIPNMKIVNNKICEKNNQTINQKENLKNDFKLEQNLNDSIDLNKIIDQINGMFFV